MKKIETMYKYNRDTYELLNLFKFRAARREIKKKKKKKKKCRFLVALFLLTELNKFWFAYLNTLLLWGHSVTLLYQKYWYENKINIYHYVG